MSAPTAPAVPAAARPRDPGVELLRGHAALARLFPALVKLHDAVGAPLTARAPWIGAAFSANPELEPHAVLVRRPEGRIEAAVALSVARRGEQVVVGAPRPGSDDRLALAARSPRAACLLVDGVVAWLSGLSAPWRVELTGLDPEDLAVRLLAMRLPGARVEALPDVPALCLEAAGTDTTQLLRDDARRRVRRARRRLAADAVHSSVHVVSQRDAVVALLDTLEATHRARDHDAGRPSDLDDRGDRTFWRRVIVEHAVEVSLLRFDGQLAAYVIAFPDPPAYRVFDGRLASRWAGYSPGRMLEAEMLARVARDPRFARVDWMTSVAPEKLIAANDRDRAVAVVAERMPGVQAITSSTGIVTAGA